MSLFSGQKDRYSSYDSGMGAKIEQGETSFEELEVMRWLRLAACS